MASNVQSQVVPPAIVDIIVQTHRAPRPHVDQNFLRCELHSELHFPSLGQHREKKGAVGAVNRKAEDQGEAGGVEGRGDDSVQRRLDTSPRGEDDSGLEGDDAVGDGSSA